MFLNKRSLAYDDWQILGDCEQRDLVGSIPLVRFGIQYLVWIIEEDRVAKFDALEQAHDIEGARVAKDAAVPTESS